MIQLYPIFVTNVFLRFLVLCQALSLSNGNVSYDQASVNGQYSVGTVATLGCNQGYNLIGANSRVCLNLGNFHVDTSCAQGNIMLRCLRKIASFRKMGFQR